MFDAELKRLREERGLSQSQLAEKFNVRQNTVSRWENGVMQPDFYTLMCLAHFFDVSTDELLGMEYFKGKHD